MIDRRGVLRSLAVLAGGACLPRALLAGAADTPMYHEWNPLPGKNILLAAGSWGNMTLVLGKSGQQAVLIDTQTGPLGAQVRREADALGKKVALVVNTHHHPEITGGNHAFTGDTRILAHPKCKERIPGQMNRYISQVKEFLFRGEDAPENKAMPAVREDWLALHRRLRQLTGSDFAPTETLDDRRELTIDGRRLLVFDAAGSMGAHTDNDIVVSLPDDDILIVGGLVSAGTHPVIDRQGGASVQGWRAALTRLEALAGPETLIVPGEGKPGGRDLLKEQREYLADVEKAVREAIAAGKSRADVRALTPKLRLPGGGEGGSSRLSMSLDAVFEEIKAEERTPPPL